MRTPRLRHGFILVLTASLAGCGGEDLSRTFGIVRDAPDEFTVTTRAPLSMPPDFSLQPPIPGAPRPQEQSARDAAQAALSPQSVLQQDTQRTGGEQALLAAAGHAAPTDIRRKVSQDAALDSGGPSVTDELMFWRKPAQPGIVVDPTKEAQRLRTNAALGQDTQAGDTPIIQPGRKGVLDGLF